MRTKIQKKVQGRWSGFRHHSPTHVPSNTWLIEGRQEKGGKECVLEGYLIDLCFILVTCWKVLGYSVIWVVGVASLQQDHPFPFAHMDSLTLKIQESENKSVQSLPCKEPVPGFLFQDLCPTASKQPSSASAPIQLIHRNIGPTRVSRRRDPLTWHLSFSDNERRQLRDFFYSCSTRI